MSPAMFKYIDRIHFPNLRKAEFIIESDEAMATRKVVWEAFAKWASRWLNDPSLPEAAVQEIKAQGLITYHGEPWWLEVNPDGSDTPIHTAGQSETVDELRAAGWPVFLSVNSDDSISSS